MTPRLAAGVALVLVVGALVWSVGGDTPTERVPRGDEATESARDGDGSSALAPAPELAAAERAVEARAALDDRRAWSATLAFAPDMAWLVPHLSYRVDARYADGSEREEAQGELGAVKGLRLEAPECADGAALIARIAPTSSPELVLTTVELSDADSVHAIDWSDLPLVAAGRVVPVEVASRVDLEVRPRWLDDPAESRESRVATHEFTKANVIIRSPTGEFCVLNRRLSEAVGAPVRGADRTWAVVATLARIPVSAPVHVPIGSANQIVRVERGVARIRIAIEDGVDYQNLALNIASADGSVDWYDDFDSLRIPVASGKRPERALAMLGDATVRYVDAPMSEEPGDVIVTGGPWFVHAFSVGIGEIVDVPPIGELPVRECAGLATLHLPVGSPHGVRGEWGGSQPLREAFAEYALRDPGRGPFEASYNPGWYVFDEKSFHAQRDHFAAEFGHGRRTAKSLVFGVPNDVSELVMSATGHATLRVAPWTAGVREFSFEPLEPVRLRIDRSLASDALAATKFIVRTQSGADRPAFQQGGSLRPQPELHLPRVLLLEDGEAAEFAVREGGDSVRFDCYAVVDRPEHDRREVRPVQLLAIRKRGQTEGASSEVAPMPVSTSAATGLMEPLIVEPGSEYVLYVGELLPMSDR